MEKGFDSLSLDGMDRLGRALADALFDGAFIAMYGDLGAGKTTLVKSVAAELGIYDVLSPTFTIVREHEGSMKLFHFDAYRLSDADELYAIGFDDYMRRGGVCIMEWPQNVSEALPAERLDIFIEGSGDMRRKVKLSSHGEKYDAVIAAAEGVE